MKTIQLVCDNGRTHHGKHVRTWWVNHARVGVHFTPVQCSWMHHVEPWWSSLQRKRWRIVEVASKDHLRQKREPCLREWNGSAHPCHWSTKSVAKVMAA